MQIFYSANVFDGKALFSREESGHCLRVLRMRRGQSLAFTDGKGNLYRGVITDDDPSGMIVRVTSAESGYGMRNYSIHIAISPLKNDDRLEWFVEKAVETGIDEITPLICSRTEKTRIRKERLEGLILSAMKQSVKCYLPCLHDPVPFTEFLSGNNKGRRLIASCDPDTLRTDITSSFSRGENVTVLIGPEGDFTVDELAMAIKEGFEPVHMGPSRFRSETAGVIACCSVYLANI
jgi:16S rRNA (uracil1498-N3)-methyltransferase